MAKQLYTNAAESTLSGTLSQGGTTMVLATGQGSLFPAPTGGDYFLLTLFQKDLSSNETRIEVVQVTARTADTLTIVRDYESMTGQAGGYSYPQNPGDIVYAELRWTAAAATNCLQESDPLNMRVPTSGKTTPVDADYVVVVDTADSSLLKRLTWANIKATLKSYFDSLYAAVAHTHTGTYEPADATILKDADIGSSVQGYSASTAMRSDKLSAFAATSSSELAGVISDETGTGKLMFNDSPVIADDVTIGTAGVASGQIKLKGSTSGTATLTTDATATKFSFDKILEVLAALSATGNISFDGGTFVFNESGADKDFRCEGDTIANLFFIDASTDRIGIGTNTPSALLDIAGVMKLIGYTETRYAPAAGTAFTVDLANGSIQRFTSNGNITITLPSSVDGKSYVVEVAYGGTHTVTWAGGGTIKHAGGTAAAATSTNGKIDRYVMECDGTNTLISDGGRNF